MPTVIDELVTILGVEMAPGVGPTIIKFENWLNDAAKSALITGGKITAAATAFVFLATKINAAAEDLVKFEMLTGNTTDTLQGLQHAIEQVGGNADSLKQDLMGLTTSMSSPIPGEFNQALFWLGVQVRDTSGELKTSSELLFDIADRFQDMTRIEQLQWGKKIGLSNDTILLLKMGREEMTRLQAQAESIPTIVSKEQLQKAREFIIQMSFLRRIVTQFAQDLSANLGPILTKINIGFVEWIQTNRDLLRLRIEETINKIVLVYRKFQSVVDNVKDSFLQAFPWVKEFLDKLDGSDVIVALLLGALTSLVSMTSKLGIMLLLAGGKLAFVGLIIEDFIVYMNDGQSAIGLFIDWIGKLYTQFADRFPGIDGFVKDTWQGLKDFYAWVTTADIGAWVDDLHQKFKDKFPGIAGFVKFAIDGLKENIERLYDAFERTAVFDTFKAFATLVGNTAKGLVVIVDKLLQLAGFSIFEQEQFEPARSGAPRKPFFEGGAGESFGAAGEQAAQFRKDVVGGFPDFIKKLEEGIIDPASTIFENFLIPLVLPGFKDRQQAAAQGTTNNISITNHIKSTDPVGAGSEVANSIRRQVGLRALNPGNEPIAQ